MVLAFRHRDGQPGEGEILPILVHHACPMIFSFLYIYLPSPPVRSVPQPQLFQACAPSLRHWSPVLPLLAPPQDAWTNYTSPPLSRQGQNSRRFEGLGSQAVMEQNNEPNKAALYITRKRQGSVGASQILESIVSGSNCQLYPFQFYCFCMKKVRPRANSCLRDSRPG